MSLARATLSGIVSKDCEKRFTTNNIAITTFLLDFSETSGESNNIVVKSIGNMADIVAQSLRKGDRVVVEGRLQIQTIKSEDGGYDKKVFEIDMSSFEKIGVSALSVDRNVSVESAGVAEFSEQEQFEEELIPEDEIPF